MQIATCKTEEQFSDDILLIKTLWGTHYHDVMIAVMKEDPELTQQVVQAMGTRTQQYCKRLKGDDLVQYLGKDELRASALISVLLKSQNVKHRSLFLAARSISGYRQQIPTKWWNTESKCRLMLGKTKTLSLIKTMMDHCPPPEFEVSNDISEYLVDQCHIWKGCQNKHGSRGTERVDENGEKVTVQQVTIANVLHFPVPNEFDLSPEDRQYVERYHSIYDRPFDYVVRYLDYTRCRGWLDEAWTENAGTLPCSSQFSSNEDVPDSQTFPSDTPIETVTWGGAVNDIG